MFLCLPRKVTQHTIISHLCLSHLPVFKFMSFLPSFPPRQDAGGIKQTVSFSGVTWNRNPKQRHQEILRFKDKPWQPESMKNPKGKFFLCDPSSTKEIKVTSMSVLETWLVQGWKQWSVGMRLCTQRQDSFFIEKWTMTSTIWFI